MKIETILWDQQISLIDKVMAKIKGSTEELISL